MNAPAPRANPDLIGQEAAERALVEARAAGRLHHAWLLTGTEGIGKATLAYRFARFLLARGSAAGSLAVDPADPVFRRVAAGTHADLMTVERGMDEKRKRMRQEIVVDEVREVSRFLRLTPGEGGWRIVIVDGAEDMNPNAANALLKLLEEPPQGAMMLLTCHAPGRLPATIRSRCRRLRLSPLTEGETEFLLVRYLPEMAEQDRSRLARLAEGSPGRALALAEGDGPAMAERVARILTAPPSAAAALTVADEIGRDEESFTLFMDMLCQAVSAEVRQDARDGGAGAGPAPRSLGRWGEVWQGLTRLQEETERFSLDRRQAVLAGLSLMAAEQ
jgi:DNA polymerase III subunit delta'